MRIISFELLKAFLLIAAILRCEVAAAQDAKSADISLKAFYSSKSNEITFKLTNISGAALEIEKDFSHWQNMYLVIKRERPFDDVVAQTEYATDPAIGSYLMTRRGSYVEERVDLNRVSTKLFDLSGDALVFWSVKINTVKANKPNSSRFSGAFEIHLPLQRNSK